MSQTFPPFAVTTVGSWPRPTALLRAMKRGSSDLVQLQNEAVVAAVRAQEDAGADIITDGEQRRDNFTSFLSESVSGFRRMSMADLLDHVEDKAAFETLLQTLDVPAYAIRNNVAVGRLKAAKPLVMDDLAFLRTVTKRPIKVTLPGPYILVRSSWVEALSRPAFSDRRELCDDVVALLRAELQALIDTGVDVVQFDEPVLTELAFAGKSNTHTFMCAALAANANPESELDLAVELMNRVIDGLNGPIRAMHICRGNWSRDEGVLLQGSYDALLPHLARMHIDQYVLEYATERAGDPALLSALPQGSSIGFGVVNPRTDAMEDPREVAVRVRALAHSVGHERIHLNPDCGFGTFAERPMNSADNAQEKVHVLAQAAQLLRSGEV